MYLHQGEKEKVLNSIFFFFVLKDFIFFSASQRSCSSFFRNRIFLALLPPFIYRPAERGKEMMGKERGKEMMGKEGKTKSRNVVSRIQLISAK